MSTERISRSDLASIRRITPEEAWNLSSETKGTLIDTRPRDFYNEAHAEGALSLPFDEIRRDAQTAIERLPSDQQLVFYCT
jgi:rhodanese-related sulfurtransferase